MGGRSSNASRNTTQKITFAIPVVGDRYAVDIRESLESFTKNPTEDKLILIGQRDSMQDSILSAEDKKTVVSAIKGELKRLNVNANVSITTPKIGPGAFAQYLHIKKK